MRIAGQPEQDGTFSDSGSPLCAMDVWLRSLVSGSRSRTRELGVDLDLTYITPQLIAMSFPALGMEAFYRNRMQDVAHFLNTKHTDKYLVFNLSEREYPTSFFAERCMSLGFPDHHSAPVEVAWHLVLSMHSWLSQDPSHVAVVHCLAGKGRTGVIIACYMLFSGFFFSLKAEAAEAAAASHFTLPSPEALADTALRWFASKRGGGCTYPSQIRTVGYLPG
jgi:hypothetical protein